MADKVLVDVKDWQWDENGLTLWVDIARLETPFTRHYNLQVPVIDPLGSGISDNQEVKTFAKQYAIDNLEVTFGLMDTVRLLRGIDLI